MIMTKIKKTEKKLKNGFSKWDEARYFNDLWLWIFFLEIQHNTRALIALLWELKYKLLIYFLLLRPYTFMHNRRPFKSNNIFQQQKKRTFEAYILMYNSSVRGAFNIINIIIDCLLDIRLYTTHSLQIVLYTLLINVRMMWVHMAFLK